MYHHAHTSLRKPGICRIDLPRTRAGGFAALDAGAQQRIAIRPQLILADEPTGDLDRGLSDHVWRLLRVQANDTGATILAATYDPTALRYAATCYTLEADRIASGS